MKETKIIIGMDDTVFELTEKDINMEILIYMFKAIAAIDKKLDEKKPTHEDTNGKTGLYVKIKPEHVELLEAVAKSSAEIKRMQEENNVLLRKCFERNFLQAGERFSTKKETT